MDLRNKPNSGGKGGRVCLFPVIDPHSSRLAVRREDGRHVCRIIDKQGCANISQERDLTRYFVKHMYG